MAVFLYQHLPFYLFNITSITISIQTSLMRPWWRSRLYRSVLLTRLPSSLAVARLIQIKIPKFTGRKFTSIDRRHVWTVVVEQAFNQPLVSLLVRFNVPVDTRQVISEMSLSAAAVQDKTSWQLLNTDRAPEMMCFQV